MKNTKQLFELTHIDYDQKKKNCNYNMCRIQFRRLSFIVGLVLYTFHFIQSISKIIVLSIVEVFIVLMVWLSWIINVVPSWTPPSGFFVEYIFYCRNFTQLTQ